MISLAGKLILVVDDEQMLREILVDELSMLGAQVLESENGTLAFELLKKRNFDVLISDVRMAGGDGLKLLNNIKEYLPIKPKLFLCSGFNDITKDSAKFLGVIEVFPKPFDADKIAQSVSEALQISGSKVVS